ncbi:MAG: C-GCAxxG-C-C family protein [Halobacteriota archaeon]
MTKADEAVALFNQGFICSQAVLSVFASDYSLDQDTALRITQGFGAGMARTDDVCGVVAGAIMVIGLRYGATQADDSAAREKTYAVINEFIREFTKRNGTVSCTALLGYNLSDQSQRIEAHESGVVPARCPGFVGAAVELIETLV